MKVKGWAIPWYREEDWARWRAICPDFQPHYKTWLELAAEQPARCPADAGIKGRRGESRKLSDWKRKQIGRKAATTRWAAKAKKR